MTAELDITFVAAPVRGVPVPVTSVDVTPIQGPCVLNGWSFREASGELAADVSGSVTSPAALATIATTASLPPGTYTIAWTVGLAGTLAAADANNMRLVDSAGNVLTAIMPAVAGTYPQANAQVTTTVAGAVLVQAIALATVGAVYSADIVVSPSLQPTAIVELQDGGQVLGESAMQAQGTDTEVMPREGVRVSGQVKVHVIQGAVAGVLYATFDKQS